MEVAPKRHYLRFQVPIRRIIPQVKAVFNENIIAKLYVFDLGVRILPCIAMIQGGRQVGITIWNFEFCTNRFKFLQGRLAQTALKIFVAFTGKNPAAGKTICIYRALTVDIVGAPASRH